MNKKIETYLKKNLGSNITIKTIGEKVFLINKIGKIVAEHTLADLEKMTGFAKNKDVYPNASY